ncbi:MAG TPA: ABC transporter permease [Steroidobacteraceae bacterium]|nr:ABC transporter permease [Steroidobacteraceae bacterium]
MFANVWFDLKYAWSLLCKSPGYALLCTIVVGLSVGLALWCYWLFYGAVLKPVPFPGSGRWLSVQIAPKATQSGDPHLDAYTYQQILEHRHAVRHLGAFAARAAVLSDGQASSSLRAAAITPGLLAAMHVAPHAGRLFGAADGAPGAAPTVILSFEAWQRYFASDAHVIGREARIDGRNTLIVGVMPRDFLAFQDFELWLPLRLETLAGPSDSSPLVEAFIAADDRLGAQALAQEMQRSLDAVDKSYPQLFDAGRRIELYPLRLMYFHDNVPILATLTFLAGAVLLLGCLNVGMIFFARLLERSRELALRVALGASRARLLQQSLIETVFVMLLGLLLGIALARLGLQWANSLGDFQSRIEGLGRQEDIGGGASDVGAAVIAAVVVWLLSTLIPAWRIARQDAVVVLAGGGKGTAGPRTGRSVRLLVGLQVAVSSLVLVACANVVLAVVLTGDMPTGLQASRVMLTTEPTVFDARHADPATRLRYWDELTAAVQSRMPGTQVAYATMAPTGRRRTWVSIENAEGADRQGRLMLPVTEVSANYFELLGIRLRSGRLFDSSDTSDSRGVVVVDENVAHHYWPRQEALGKRIRVSAANGPWLRIVGVVSHVRGRPNSDETVSYVYRPLRQTVPAEFRTLVKLPAVAPNARAVLRAAAYGVDRDLPLHNLQTFDDYLNALDLEYKSLGPAFSAIAVVTMILAATGLFGLISRSVAARTQEVGVRRALGGSPWRISAIFLRQGVTYLGVGLGGLCAGVVVTNLLDATIGNILPHVTTVTLGVLLLIAVVIFGASYLPTRRALALEPGDALRHE